jgi:DinB family
MSPENAKAAVEVIASWWEGEFAATCQVLAAVKDDKRGYKPDPKSLADIWFIDSIINGAFVWDPEKAKAAEGSLKSVADVVSFYKKTFPEKLNALRALPAEKFTEVIDFFGFMKMPRASFVAMANNHSIHHRGQLAAYLRAHGAKVPNIYGPSADAEPAA